MALYGVLFLAELGLVHVQKCELLLPERLSGLGYHDRLPLLDSRELPIDFDQQGKQDVTNASDVLEFGFGVSDYSGTFLLNRTANLCVASRYCFEQYSPNRCGLRDDRRSDRVYSVLHGNTEVLIDLRDFIRVLLCSM